MSNEQMVIVVEGNARTRTIWRPARSLEEFAVADADGKMVVAAIDRWRDGVWVRERPGTAAHA